MRGKGREGKGREGKNEREGKWKGRRMRAKGREEE